jgi:phytoene/squalene synthetase
MKSRFDKVAIACSKLTTVAYSTSFSLGIRFLSRKIHAPIYAIYGYVRFADEIVDSFHDYNKAALLEAFTRDTWLAIEQRISLNPILNSFQETVHRFDIDHELIRVFLASMEMDLHKRDYDRAQYEQYIVGSAEVVGLMCLHVFTNGDKKHFETLKPYAMRLGAAFQKVNFLRDMKDDYIKLGRTYFPSIEMNEFTLAEKRAIEADIEHDFTIALQGIRQLPSSAKAGVYLAYYYYYQLFRKIKNCPPHRILQSRIRINNARKLGLLVQSMVRYQINLL